MTQPLVTFVLFAYNQESFISGALKGLFSQSYENIEFILSDDCSSDATFDVMNDAYNKYKDSKRVVLNRNDENLGFVRHFNKILKISKGEIIVVAAGDDISLPDRVHRTVELFEENEDVTIVSFKDHQMDMTGTVTFFNSCNDVSKSSFVDCNDLLSATASRLSGASRGFRASLFSLFGELNDDCPTEDTPYMLRGLLVGRGYSCSLPGIYYRKHMYSLSAESSMHRMNLDAIEEQYKKDIDCARKQGYISQVMFEKMRHWVEKTIRHRKLKKQIYDNKSLFSSILLRLVLSPDFSIKEKLSLIKKYFKRLFLKY